MSNDDEPAVATEHFTVDLAAKRVVLASGADVRLTPTEWQASGFPPPIRRALTVLHEGIDTKVAAPDPGASFPLPDGRTPRDAVDFIYPYLADKNKWLADGYHKDVAHWAGWPVRQPCLIFAYAEFHDEKYFDLADRIIKLDYGKLAGVPEADGALLGSFAVASK